MSSDPTPGPWPESEAGPHSWPTPREATSLLEQRFASASTTPLGTDDDRDAISTVVRADHAPAETEIGEVRWLSPTVVMAYVRTRPAAYYDVVEKTLSGWSVAHSYLIWIT